MSEDTSVNDTNNTNTKETVVVEKEKSHGSTLGFAIGIAILLFLLFIVFVRNPFAGGESNINVNVPTPDSPTQQTTQ